MTRENTLIAVDQELMLKDYWDSICQVHNIQDNRERRNIIYKHAFSVCCREYSSLSLATIGKIINKNHATILHSVRNHSSNYLYDKTYRGIYDTIAEDMSEKMMEYNKGVDNLLEKRIERIDATAFNSAMVKLYKTKMEKQKESYDVKIAALNKDISILKKHLKISRKREQYLNAECLRLKNLL